MAENNNAQNDQTKDQKKKKKPVPPKPNFKVDANPLSKVRKVIGVVSGKGGVGKTTVTSELAVALRQAGGRVGIMDADITGPSIPKAFGVMEKARGTENYIYPVTSKSGIDLMSMNLLLPHDTDPVIWRGPVIAGVVKQFWTDVVWTNEDVLLIDMPPGTGDVPLTIFQSLPVDGIIIVTSPQDLVSMIVEKAMNMAKMMNIDVLGLVENYSYLTCPHCGERINVFGDSDLDTVAEANHVDILGRLPIDPQVAALMDEGAIEDVDLSKVDLSRAVEKIQAVKVKADK